MYMYIYIYIYPKGGFENELSCHCNSYDTIMVHMNIQIGPLCRNVD